MIAVDTSVVVAAFASWHEGHVVARATLSTEVRLPAHVALEVYSVLTRLPPPHRAKAGFAASFLRARFGEPLLELPAPAYLALIDEASDKHIEGGAVYDALVAATARHWGAKLLTRDRRAIRTYDALGVPYELVG